MNISHKPEYEVADIFPLYGEQYRSSHRMPIEQLNVMRNIENCRTAVMGGHVERCDCCDFERNAYNSCGDRHCPKCGAMAKERWLDNRKHDLIPAHYFHLVFTLSHSLNFLVRYNMKPMLDILFSSVNATLQTFSQDPQWRINGQLGCIAVLHTWNQLLLDHFHIHCLIPGRALSRDKQRWTPSGEKFLFKVQSLAKRFKSEYIFQVQKAYDQNELRFPKDWTSEQVRTRFAAMILKIRKEDWIVYAKSPFAGPEKVLEYLARYTHRVAISNHRIVAMTGGKITFSYKDRSKKDDKEKPAVRNKTIDADTFIHRFLLHVLPKKFMKIRYFGFLSSGHKSKNLKIIRNLINPNIKPAEKIKETVREMMFRITGIDINQCPKCKKGKMVMQYRLPKWFIPNRRFCNEAVSGL